MNRLRLVRLGDRSHNRHYFIDRNRPLDQLQDERLRVVRLLDAVNGGNAGVV